jgi:cytidylate kinase
MSVITISRGTLSGGRTLAECLAQRLGYRCVDRDVIVERAAAQGVSHQELRDALEKPPSFLDHFQHKKYMYLVLMQAALAEEVVDDQVIYHGNAGHLLLGGGAPVLRVRIIAPLELRLRMAGERLRLSREEAILHIEKMDRDRRRWTQYLYGIDWGDPALYDIVVNLEHITIDQACTTVASLVRSRCYQFDAECRRKMNDLVTASRVRVALVLNPATANLEVEVESHDGIVSLRGKLRDVHQAPEIEKVAWGVPGVTGVNMDELAPAAHS